MASLGTVARWWVRLASGGLPPASCDRAVLELRRAVELEPNELSHRVELGFAYLANGNVPAARREFGARLALPCRAKFDAEAKSRAWAVLARNCALMPASR